MTQSHLDTIVAPATSPGRSALAIIRIDGPVSGAILEELTGELPAERLASFRRLRHRGELLDEGVVVRYLAPRSFTGNDLVELSVHGNPLLVERVCRACVDLGARFAEAGEFTERAVLNGKLDLVQAEAIGDLINSRTALQAQLSLRNLEGTLSRAALAIRESLLFVISRLEATLDFSEEGYEFLSADEVRRRLEEALEETEAMLGTYERGRVTISGINAVILGRPNAGKSTLLNRLVGSERAIVTAIPGTTRDIVRETIEIGGLPVTLADTAGLREVADDVVERIGIERARTAAESAELVLYLVDSSASLKSEDEVEWKRLTNPLMIYTKTDLVPAPEGELGISATTGEGVAELLVRLDGLVRERFGAPEAALVHARQEHVVGECRDALQRALLSIEESSGEEILLVDLYSASQALGSLTGVISQDEIFTEIFSKFCIGK